MNHSPRVSMIDGVAHLPKQRDSLRNRQIAFAAVAVEPHAIDVFHDEVRQAVASRTAVEQTCDVGVIEIGEACVIGAGALIMRSTQPREVYIAQRTKPDKRTSDQLGL